MMMLTPLLIQQNRQCNQGSSPGRRLSKRGVPWMARSCCKTCQARASYNPACHTSTLMHLYMASHML